MNENVKEMRNYLYGIFQNVDAPAVLIKHLEQHMTHFSTTINLRIPDTLPINTIKNPKNDSHCMKNTTRGGKKTINQPMLSGVDTATSKDDDMVEVIGESVNATKGRSGGN